MARYCSDDAYRQFYNMSGVEKKLVQNMSANSMLEGPSREQRLANRTASGDGPSQDQIEKFQQAFAMWGGVQQGGLRSSDFRSLLKQLGVALSPAQARALWKEHEAKEGTQRMAYEDVMQAYLQVTNSSITFDRAPGAARTPTPPLAEEEILGKTRRARAGNQGAGRGGGGVSGSLGASGDGRSGSSSCLELSIDEARNFLLEEGLPVADVDSFLQPFVDNLGHAVPQAAIFDYLTGQSGVQEDED